MKSKKGTKAYCDEKTLKKGFGSTKMENWTNQREYSQEEMPAKDFSKKPKSKKG